MKHILHTLKTHKKAVLAGSLICTLALGSTAFAAEPAAEPTSTPLPDQYCIAIFGSHEKDADDGLGLMLVTIDNENQNVLFYSVPESMKLKTDEEEPKEMTLQEFFKSEGVDETLEQLELQLAVQKDDKTEDEKEKKEEAAEKASEEELDIHIDDYIISDFDEFVTVVDRVGGVDVSLSKEEASALAKHFKNKSYKAGDDCHLDGQEALWLCRYKTGPINGKSRNEVQRRIAKSMLSQINDMNLEECLDMSADFIENVRDTSVTSEDIDFIFSMPFSDYEVSSGILSTSSK